MKEASLGRGLSALIPKRNAPPAPQAEGPAQGEMLKSLPADLIDANPHQPRQTFDYQSLEDLVASIRVHGILQPLIVTEAKNGRYELVAGERRLRAAKTLGLKTIPAVVRTVSQQSRLELALIENIQRKDLNPLEEAEAYATLVEEFGLTQATVAQRVGKNRATVANILRLLTLPAEIQKSIRSGRITMGHAKVILSATEPSQQLRLWQTILKSDLTVRGGEAASRSYRTKRSARSSSGNPELQAMEEKLRDKLKTRVKISRRGGQGAITIEFYSTEELGNIIRAIIS